MRYMIKNPIDGTVRFVDEPSIISLPASATEIEDSEWGKRHLIIPAAIARQTRNKLIAECDWTVLLDVQLDESQKAAWINYRKSLRDISNQPDFPLVIVWPTIP